MKRFLFLVALLFSLNLTAQKKKPDYSKHFVNFRFGYSIPVSSNQIGSPREEVGKTYITAEEDLDGNTIKYSEKNSFGSRGAGFNLSLGYGYMITQNFSVEIDFNYLHTLSIKDAYVNRTNSKGNVYSASQNSTTNMFRVMPMMGVYANESLLIRPYAKFGLLIPLAGGTTVNIDLDDKTGVSFDRLMPAIDYETFQKIEEIKKNFATIFPDLVIPTKTSIKAVTSGAFSLGFMARLGAEYKFRKILDGRMKLFAEFEIQMLKIKAKQTIIKAFHSEVTDDVLKQFSNNLGISTEIELEDIPEILRLTNYKNELTEVSNSSFDVSNPNYKRDAAYEQLAFRDNYNAFAFMLGLKFSF